MPPFSMACGINPTFPHILQDGLQACRKFHLLVIEVSASSFFSFKIVVIQSVSGHSFQHKFLSQDLACTLAGNNICGDKFFGSGSLHSRHDTRKVETQSCYLVTLGICSADCNRSGTFRKCGCMGDIANFYFRIFSASGFSGSVFRKTRLLEVVEIRLCLRCSFACCFRCLDRG
jgi:hypothetical protein